MIFMLMMTFMLHHYLMYCVYFMLYILCLGWRPYNELENELSIITIILERFHKNNVTNEHPLSVGLSSKIQSVLNVTSFPTVRQTLKLFQIMPLS